MVNFERQSIVRAGVHERFSKNTVNIFGEIKRPFVAASIAKPYLAAAILRMHEEGSFDLTRSFHVTLDDYRQGAYGTGAYHWLPQAPLFGIRRLQHASPDARVTMRPVPAMDLLKRMVANSDNLATLVMVNAAGRQDLQQVLDYWGMKSTTVRNNDKGTDNVTTAEDVQLFLHKLHKGELIDDKLLAKTIRCSMPGEPVNDIDHKPYSHVMYSMRGDISQAGRTFAHRVGFIEGATGDHSFVILTEERAKEDGNVSNAQVKAISEILESISGFLI